MIIVSALPKLDTFQISEGLAKRKMLTHLYTGYASQKGRFINRFISRKDNEIIPVDLVSDYWPLMLASRYHKSVAYNQMFDKLVATSVRGRNDYKAILGWSGMSEHTLLEGRKRDKFVVVARGSCHIELQNEILSSEFRKYGIDYSINKFTIEKELREYDIADKIYVCSSFVKQSFVDRGFSGEKIFVNPIAVPNLFRQVLGDKPKEKFIILFLGKLTVQKGPRYLFEALEKLQLNSCDYEAWFVGAGDPIIEKEFHLRKKSNWKYLGFVPQHHLPTLISQADVGVFPSVQDGFAQVVPQQLSCGVPVITTHNTGSSDFIINGRNGYIVPTFDSDAIADKITTLFGDNELLKQMKSNALKIIDSDLSAESVANRFETFFKSHI